MRKIYAILIIKICGLTFIQSAGYCQTFRDLPSINPQLLAVGIGSWSEENKKLSTLKLDFNKEQLDVAKEVRNLLSKKSSAYSTDNIYIKKEFDAEYSQWRDGLKMKFQIIKNWACLVTEVKEGNLKCAAFSNGYGVRFDFTLAIIPESTELLKNLRSYEMIYFTTPVDQDGKDNITYDGLLTPGFKFDLNAVKIGREKFILNDEELFSMALQKKDLYKRGPLQYLRESTPGVTLSDDYEKMGYWQRIRMQERFPLFKSKIAPLIEDENKKQLEQSKIAEEQRQALARERERQAEEKRQQELQLQAEREAERLRQVATAQAAEGVKWNQCAELANFTIERIPPKNGIYKSVKCQKFENSFALVHEIIIDAWRWRWNSSNQGAMNYLLNEYLNEQIKDMCVDRAYMVQNYKKGNIEQLYFDLSDPDGKKYGLIRLPACCNKRHPVSGMMVCEQ